MAFPVEIPVLSVDPSLDGDFNGVFEHKLFYNQPVEVRVWCEGLEYQLGKISGWGYPLLSVLSPEGVMPTAL